MTYAEKLKDPRWQKKRLEILDRDNWSCKYCGDKKSTLFVHHYKYNGEPWQAENINLVTLCEYCHKYDHEYREIFISEFLEITRNLDPVCIDIINKIIISIKNNSKTNTTGFFKKIFRFVFYSKDIENIINKILQIKIED